MNPMSPSMPSASSIFETEISWKMAKSKIGASSIITPHQNKFGTGEVITAQNESPRYSTRNIRRSFRKQSEVWPHDSWHCHRHWIGYRHGFYRTGRKRANSIKH